MKILVTGAHGFIGSHLVRHLLAAGHEVRGLVSPWGDLARLPESQGQGELELVRADITEPGDLEDVCDGVEAVIHAAARLADWGPSAPLMRTNVDGTANLLNAASAVSVRRFVLVSSVAVHRYSGFRDANTESLPRDGHLTAYGHSKVGAEDLVLGWGGEGVVVRPGLWPFGPLDPQTRRVARALLDGRLPLLAGGKKILNTAYVGNLVLGLERAALAEGVGGRAFLVADEGAPSWSEVLGELAEQLGARHPRLSLPPSVVMPAATAIEKVWGLIAPDREPPLTRYRASLMRNDVHFSIEASRRDLGYRPLVSWQTGVAATVREDPVIWSWVKE